MTRMAHIAEGIGFGLWAGLIAYVGFAGITGSFRLTPIPGMALLSATLCWVALTRSRGRVSVSLAMLVGILSVVVAPTLFVVGDAAGGIAAGDLRVFGYASVTLIYAAAFGALFIPIGVVCAILFAQVSHLWRDRHVPAQ